MREMLLQANAGNLEARMVCGFQPAFETNFEGIVNVTTGSWESADIYDLLYDNGEVEVYLIQTMKKYKPMLYEVKLVAHLANYESWIVVQGLIAVSKKELLQLQMNIGKRMLLHAISDIWGIQLKKGA